MEIYWGAERQAYVTPVSSSEICVALISRSPETRFTEALRECFPVLDARLKAAASTSRERGSITATMGLRSVAQGNVALVGDASGSVDAITGEGLCLSFRQASALAKAISRGNLDQYNRAHRRLAVRPRLMAKTMLVLDKGPLIRKAAMTALAWEPRIFRNLLRVHVA
jgi:flavin-dependent dehydrogenase